MRVKLNSGKRDIFAFLSHDTFYFQKVNTLKSISFNTPTTLQTRIGFINVFIKIYVGMQSL